MERKIGTIKIDKKETTVDLGGLAPGEVGDLRIYSRNKQADLGLLAAYPHVTELFVNGDFANIDAVSDLKELRSLTMYLPEKADFSGIHGMRLQSLSVSCPIDESFSNLLTDSVENLGLMNIRRLSDLSFVERAAGLKKLYLESLPAVEALPDFGKMPNLYGLKLYELHKLNDIESLARSGVRYLAFTLAADKLSGTKLADVLLRMERLEQADMSLLDRSSIRRYTVLENQLKKSGRAQVLEAALDMGRWELL